MRIIRVVVCLVLWSLGAPGLWAAQGAPSAEPALPEPAADQSLLAEASALGVRYGGKSVTGSKVDAKLDPLVRRALNAWAGLARDLELVVVVPQKAQALVLGRAPLAVLSDAAGWADETAELFAGCPPAEGQPARGAVVMLLFDKEGFASEAWPGVLEALVTRKAITRSAADHLRDDPGSLLVRPSLLFVQPTWDMVGVASSGDDEFRLGNEVAHKTAQLFVESRFGRVPDVLRWGCGYVAEQRLFRSIYQFDATGHVAAEDHVDWPARAAEQLRTAAKQKSFSLPDTILRTPEPGTATPGQRAAWAVCDYLLAKEPAKLAALLGELAALHRAGDPIGFSLEYRGDPERTREICAAAWDLKTTTLCEHLKRVK